MKKLLALALALVVSASFAVTAFAEEAADEAAEEAVIMPTWTVAEGQAITAEYTYADGGLTGITFTSTIAGLDFTGLEADAIFMVGSQRGGQFEDRVFPSDYITVAEATATTLSLEFAHSGDGWGGISWDGIGSGYTMFNSFEFEVNGATVCLVTTCAAADVEGTTSFVTYVRDGIDTNGGEHIQDGAEMTSSITLADGTAYTFAPAAADDTAESTEDTTAPAESETTAPAETVDQAAQTFDFGIIAAAAAVVSLAGFAISKKH